MRIIWFVILVMLFPQTILATSATAKITSLRISNPSDLTRFVLEINGAPFRYQWQLSADKKNLAINIDNTILATSLPKSSPTSSFIKSYQLKSSSDKSSVQLRFQLKTALDPKIYTLPASGGTNPRLVVDFGTARAKASIDISTLAKVNKPINKIEEGEQLPQPPEYSAKKPNLTLSDSSFNRPIMIVIDPGHGGKDPGAVGPTHVREKDIVLAISKLLQQSFNNQPGFQAKLTRSNDTFVPLRQRLAIARRCKADIFIAIHADAAYKNQDAAGASVFALSERGATSEMARWLAKKENESELIYGVVVNKDPILRSVLLDLSQTHTIAVSLDMGREILTKLSNITKLHYKRVEQAAFVVLKSPDIPSLLIETGYVSNPSQEQKLKNPIYQQQLASTIVQGIVAYFEQHPPGKRFITT